MKINVFIDGNAGLIESVDVITFREKSDDNMDNEHIALTT